MRQVVLDTETTGLEIEAGHRIIEIGCVEIVGRKLTRRHYHQYINPEREIDDGALERSNAHGVQARQWLIEQECYRIVKVRTADRQLLAHPAGKVLRGGFSLFFQLKLFEQLCGFVTGIRMRDMVQVTNGLAPGDTVITSGLQQIFPGMPVRMATGSPVTATEGGGTGDGAPGSADDASGGGAAEESR